MKKEKVCVCVCENERTTKLTKLLPVFGKCVNNESIIFHTWHKTGLDRLGGIIEVSFEVCTRSTNQVV